MIFTNKENLQCRLRITILCGNFNQWRLLLYMQCCMGNSDHVRYLLDTSRFKHLCQLMLQLPQNAWNGDFVTIFELVHGSRDKLPRSRDLPNINQKEVSWAFILLNLRLYLAPFRSYNRICNICYSSVIHTQFNDFSQKRKPPFLFTNHHMMNFLTNDGLC